MLILPFFGGSLSAQDKSKTEAGSDGLDRWSFKTNVVDWLVTIPNFTVELDLPESWCKSDSLTNKMSVSLTARYNWNTSSTRLPYNVFNLMQIRPELRYYWHPREAQKGENLRDDWYLNVFLLKKAEPPAKTNRAYFLGGYLDAGTYSIKLGKYGYQGQMYSVGLTTGYAVPMYQYKRGFVDVELGVSVGLSLVTADAYILDVNANKYARVSDRCRGLSIAPFPVVSQINLSFAWRGISVKDKYDFGPNEFNYLTGRYDKKKAKRAARKGEVETEGQTGDDFWDLDAYQAPAEDRTADEAAEESDGKKSKKKKEKKEKPEKKAKKQKTDKKEKSEEEQ